MSQACKRDEFTQKCPHWSFSGVFAFLRGEARRRVVRHGKMILSGSDLPFFGRFWWIPLDRFSSSCFRSFPAHFTHWQATLCSRWEGERVWQDGGWALSVSVCVCSCTFVYLVSSACHSVCLCNQEFLCVCLDEAKMWPWVWVNECVCVCLSALWFFTSPTQIKPWNFRKFKD